jgi:hypothetical protein
MAGVIHIEIQESVEELESLVRQITKLSKYPLFCTR